MMDVTVAEIINKLKQIETAIRSEIATPSPESADRITEYHVRRMEQRVVIQRANSKNLLTIGGEEKLVTDWLAWRSELQALNRDVASLPGINEQVNKNNKVIRKITKCVADDNITATIVS